MSQSVNASLSARDAQSAKALDSAFVVAGWPTVYTVAKSYQVPSTGDLSTANGFSFGSTQAWASIPDAVGQGVKGRPEEGGITIAQLDIDVLDRVSSGKRQISDLLSRQAYLNGASPAGPTTTLSGALSNGLTETSGNITVASTSAFGNTGVIFIGLECIYYGKKTSTQFQNCVRGYRLTSQTPHPDGAMVYSDMPSIYRRRAYLYKGYQSLGLEKWAPAFGGAITGASRVGAQVTFSVSDTSWLAYANAQQMVVGNGANNPSNQVVFYSGTLTNDLLAGDYSGIAVTTPSATRLGNGHYLLKIAGHWVAVTSVT